MNIAEEVADIQARITAANTARIRAESQRDAAHDAAHKARQQLGSEFNVTTVAEGEALLAKLRDEVAALTAEIGAALDKIGV